MKILIENSSWRNIGEAWYGISLYYLLKQIYPEHHVVLGDTPISVSFRISNQKQKNNSFDLMQYQQADIHIMAGPILNQMPTLFIDKIKEIKKRKAQYALISISGTGLSQSEINEIGSFLQEYPPLLFATRDEETYNKFSKFVQNSYNGICTAFLVNKTIPTETFKLGKFFFISSFYRELEPFYFLEKEKECTLENLEIKHKKKFGIIPFKYSRHFNFLRPQQAEIGNHIIIRTIQDLNTKFNHINFAVPNSYISFNPLLYLEITKSSEFVISDRVHACATGLAYGKPVRFLFNTPRAGIFDRMNFDYKSNNGIMYPNMKKIDEEYDKLVETIKKYI